MMFEDTVLTEVEELIEMYGENLTLGQIKKELREEAQKKEKQRQWEQNVVMFYIDVYKACCKYSSKDEHELEHIGIESALLREIEDSLKFFSFETRKCLWESRGITEGEGVEEYLQFLAKEVLDIDWLWTDPYWTEKEGGK